MALRVNSLGIEKSWSWPTRALDGLGGLVFYNFFLSVSSWTPRTGLMCCSYHSWPTLSGQWEPLNWTLSLWGTTLLVLTASFTDKETGSQLYPQVPPCTSDIQRGEKVCSALFRSASASGLGVRTLRSPAGLCSPPRSRQCRSGLVSVNWLKRKGHLALKSRDILYNCNIVSHYKCIIYIRYYFLKWGVCLCTHITHACAFKYETFHSAAPHHRIPPGPFPADVEQEEVLCVPHSP